MNTAKMVRKRLQREQQQELWQRNIHGKHIYQATFKPHPFAPGAFLGKQCGEPKETPYPTLRYQAESLGNLGATTKT